MPKWTQTREEQLLEENQSCLGDAETEDSSSSYSLQECIDELQKRRIRRFSTQSRDVQHNEQVIEQGIGDGPHKDDADLINQNRHNKEQERKCKPCKNGYCYCFTSDSGDSGIPRHQQRRARKIEHNLPAQVSPVKVRQSLPAIKLNAAKDSVRSSPVKKQQEVVSAEPQHTQLTAISRLESAPENAPLIHIIQELRNNCVVSEVRVNRHKIQGTRSANASPEKPPRCLANAASMTAKALKPQQAPSAPSLNKINEVEHSEQLICSSSCLESSVRSSSNRVRHEAAGRLLQKRLKQLPVHHQRHNKPPPKPPRAQAAAASVSTLSSSSPSVRAAESILDEFLRNRGVAVNASKRRATTTKRTKSAATQTASDVHVKRDQRKSLPLTLHRQEERPLPSCPSLSDLERVVDKTKKSTAHYEMNLKKQQKNDKSPIKEISFGWAEPKIAQMLQARKEYKSQAVQAEPQTAMGWQKPHKVDLDVVDGVRQNLAINIENKKTPIKQTTRYIWGEQLLGQSPWAKSNLKCSKFSRDLLQKSKKRILRLVSPKKHNKTAANIIMQRSVAVQTTCDDFIDCKHSSASPNSAPGCYQSTTNMSLASPNSQQNSEQAQFDFSRVIHSPRITKKATRKLNFSPKTYRSFQSDIDQDVNFSKMGYILSNIKAKLEASDEHAVRTFQEIERAEQQNIGYDVIDSPNRVKNADATELMHKTNAEIHNDVVLLYKRAEHHEPIYSEIEEDSLVISSSPLQDNKTGVHHFLDKTDAKAVYAQVKKPKKLLAASTSTAAAPMALGQFLQNSLRTLPSISEAPMLATTTEPPLASSECSSLPSQQSLNNIRRSLPNKQLSKSDLSLQRSEIFLDNLCRSDLNLEKNNNLEQSFASTSVSYEMPENDMNYDSELSQQQNHSTPKKLESEHSMSPEVFMTKTYMSDDARQQLEMHAVPMTENAHSFDSNLTRCKRIKNILRRSLRKSCNLVKFVDTTRLSKSLNLSTSRSSPMRLETTASLSDAPFNDIDMDAAYCFASSYHLDTLFRLDDETPVQQQIAQAVAICRQLPALEVSAEMVEAERLLLCSTLRQRQQETMLKTHKSLDNTVNTRRYFIDGLRLPVRENPSQDIFFNYFYIVTIMCDGVLRSTQSVECCNQQAIFKNCGIEFNCSSQHIEHELQAEIFMLRLRKVSTLSMEPLKPMLKPATKNNASAGSSSNDEIVSRFRLQGSFTLQARDFVPYEYVSSETCRSDSICLRTAKSCLVPLQQKSKSSNLVNSIQVLARAEARIAKFKHSGLLNVQEASSLHHWNQRWCILDGIYISVWRDVNHIDKQPMLQLDLRNNFLMNFKLPLTECAREICARQRSFCLQHVEETEVLSAVFFAAENQTDLNVWLQNLNATLQLIYDWML